MGNFSGHLSLQAEARADGRTVLAGQSFRAPYHISKPYWDHDASTLVVQVVNPTAGILEGDALESDVHVGAEAALQVTTPSASRIFCMRHGTAECRQAFRVDAGGWLELAPEPLVPHRGCRYRPSTRVDVVADGELFLVDQLVPGRVGHGEAWAWASLVMETEVYREGELILRERFAQSGPHLRALSDLAGSGPTACFGNAILVAAGDGPWLRQLASLHGPGVWLGVSPLRCGGWSIKFVTTDSIRLRRVIRDLRAILAPFYPRLAGLPRKF